MHGMALESEGQIRFDLCETLEMWSESMAAPLEEDKAISVAFVNAAF